MSDEVGIEGLIVIERRGDESRVTTRATNSTMNCIVGYEQAFFACRAGSRGRHIEISGLRCNGTKLLLYWHQSRGVIRPFHLRAVLLNWD